jgi:hypothetical protein
MTVRDGKAVLAPTNPKDEYQHWIKDMRWSTSVKDQEWYPTFRAGEQGDGEAIKHSLGPTVAPGAAGALQPGLPGRLEDLDGEP